MSDWTEFSLAFLAFFASHGIPVRPPVKDHIVALIGARGFTLAYSALSIAVLVWLIGAAGRTPYVELWPRETWQTHVPLSVMSLATIIIALALFRPNPLSFGGANNDAFDPAHPGIVGWFRHPLLVALALWSGAHIVPNGDLAHVILFGTFLAFSILGMKMIDRRKKRMLGDDWRQLTKTAPRIEITPGGVARIALGLGLYGLLIWLHSPVIGINPLP